MNTDHWSRNTIDFLSPHLSQAQSEIRIATGFFTVQGFNLLRPYLVNKRLYVLVGFDENSAERLRAKMVDDIVTHLSRWDAEDRRSAVIELIEKIERGEFRIVEREATDFLDARIRSGDHAKLYVVDNNLVLVGSSNLTVSGLRNNFEAVLSNNDADRVAQWICWFEEYWNAPDTYDLTQALLEALQRWLELVRPFDVYLKTILALVPEDRTPSPRDSYKMPVEYQQVIIERMLRQLKTWQGAFLVASTGLGKTIMATHTAYRLRLMDDVLNVLVFAPKQIQPDWRHVLDSAGLSYKVFTRDLLDQPATKRTRHVNEMLDALEQVDEKYIIFIDESHRFRNRINATGDRERYSFQRLADIIKRKKPKVILLTATPFAKGVEDLNNQLHLLPHTGPRNVTDKNGQMVFDEWADEFLDTNAWHVDDTESFFEDFMNLPVCTVISTSQVAKNFAKTSEEGEYIHFGEGKQWFPQIAVRKITVPVLLEHEMSRALDAGLFKHQMVSFKSRIGFQRTDSTIEQQAMVAWTSSPLALREVLQGTISNKYDVVFRHSDEERSRVLGGILHALESISYDNDLKLQALCHALRGFKTKNEKVVIFTERLATAIYIEQALDSLMPDLRVGNVVQQSQSGEYELKDFDKAAYDLILDFAPEANRDKTTNRKQTRELDVLISTDAYAAGVNLQDASVVISYDLAWTPETIIQRVGRILRLWKEPRKISFHLFVGDFQEDMKGRKGSERLEKRLRQLVHRTHQAEKFSEIPLFPEGGSAEYTSLGPLSNVTISDLGMADLSKIEEFSGVSDFLVHITALSRNMTYAKNIRDDIASALTCKVEREQMYLLLRYRDEYSWLLYDVENRRLIKTPTEDVLLDLISCTKETPPALVDPNILDQIAQEAKRAWMRKNGIDAPDSVERVCAMHLLPKSTDENEHIRLP